MCINFPLLFSVLNLLFVGGLTSTRGYFWKFKIRETYTISKTSITSLVSTGDCHPKGCQVPMSISFKPRFGSTLRSGSFVFTCPFFTQTKNYCKRGAKWTQEYGGCPYWSCHVYWVLGSKGPDNKFHFYLGENGATMLHIPEPWDKRWVQGEQAAIYAQGDSSKPSAHIMISRELTLPITTQKEVTTHVLQSEQNLHKSLHQPSTPQPGSNYSRPHYNS
jgi:hypothetical protein